MNDTTKFNTTVKNVKHDFTAVERGDLGRTLAMAISERRNIEAEFDQVKAHYKAKISEADANIGNISTNAMNGFEMRNERCVVIYRPDAGEKDFYLETVALSAQPTFEEAIIAKLVDPVLTEKMTKDDFQSELLMAEEKFEHRCIIDLFPPAGNDNGIMVVGKFGGRWYSALRITVGKTTLTERLDSEQKSFKKRADAVRRAGKRAAEWFEDKFKANAKGFQDPLAAAINAQLEREE